jgi:tetratricopeptide (TPR) repeat protein
VNDPDTQHPEHEEIIRPVKPQIHDASSLPPLAAQPGDGRRALWPAAVVLSGLLVVALGVIFLLPGWVADQEEQQAAEPSEPVEVLPEVSPEPVLSPEELEQLREEAEALLADLLPQQARLTELSAESWGEETWAEYEESARTGDDAYLANDFQDAVPAYTRALEVGEILLARSVSIIDSALQAGSAALDAGNATLASEQYGIVLAIEPDNAAARRGFERAARLPDVLRVMRDGEVLERDGELEDAATAFREALAIDSEWAPARSALANVEARLQNLGFDSLMSQGFSALAEEDFDEALEQFTAALAMRPSSEEAMAGRLQAEQGQRLDQIALIEARAIVAEATERWARATDFYETALETDATLVFAQEGLERARRRSDLDSKLAYLLDNPNLLFDDTVLADSQALLADAQSVDEPGPRLTEQSTELERLLRLASTPIPIELQSDELTEVTVYRVGELGSFAQRMLELRPGTYTAIGSRDGYRDVRQTFTILPGRPVEPVRVECSEPI